MRKYLRAIMWIVGFILFGIGFIFADGQKHFFALQGFGSGTMITTLIWSFFGKREWFIMKNKMAGKWGEKMNDFDDLKNVCGYEPQAEQVIKKLKESGYKLIIASNPIFPMVAQKNVWNGQD